MLAMHAAVPPRAPISGPHPGYRQCTGRADPAGELAKAMELIAAGTDIDYVGASAVELIGPGESAGNYREIEFVDGAITTVKFR